MTTGTTNMGFVCFLWLHQVRSRWDVASIGFLISVPTFSWTPIMVLLSVWDRLWKTLIRILLMNKVKFVRGLSFDRNPSCIYHCGTEVDASCLFVDPFMYRFSFRRSFKWRKGRMFLRWVVSWSIVLLRSVISTFLVTSWLWCVFLVGDFRWLSSKTWCNCKTYTLAVNYRQNGEARAFLDLSGRGMFC